MKKTLLLLTFLPMLAFAQDKDFKIGGKVENLPYQIDWVYLQYRINGESISDSFESKDGKYEFSGHIPEPLQARLRVKYKPGNDGRKIPAIPARDMVIIFLEPGKMKINSVDSFSNVQVKGSEAQNEYVKLTELEKPYNDRMKPLIDQYSAYAKAKDRENMAKVEEQLDALDNEINDKVYGEYVKSNPSSPLAMYALLKYAGYDIDPDKIEPVFNSLPKATREYPSAMNFQENLEIARKTGVGKMAMDFTQNDTLGHPVSLSSFKGQYVLVDFWASWCGPCRAENPNVVRIFNKFKGKNFHIIGVSLDRPGQKEKWMKAIHDDKLEWTQVSDLKFWDNDVAKQYGIKAIPQNLLLDPEGKIIAKNLRGDELEQKLSDAIEGKKAF
jgi:peroxiredoxin